MTQLLVYSVACFGLAFILGQSKISLPFRVLLDPGVKTGTFGQASRLWLLWLLECPACLGFWFGLAYGRFVHPIGEVGIIGTALFTCGSNFLLASFTEGLNGRNEA